MLELCLVCDELLGEPIFSSQAATSLTSHCEIRPGRTTVYFCHRCAHLQTPPLADLDTFYAAEYNLLIDSEEEDQLYEIRGERRVFRADHQIETLLSKAPPAQNAKVLDFGCGKGATAKKLLAHRPDVAAFVFEVSDNYCNYWKNFLPPERCRTFDLPADWSNRFDLVMSYFVLEHVVNLTALLQSVARVLVGGGQLYFVVPNVWVNPADFVVTDHVHHYSEASLRALLTRHGFHEVSIDAAAHQSAFVVVARKKVPEHSAIELPTVNEVAPIADRARRLADFWSEVGKEVIDYERTHSNPTGSAIYGSGFYGSYLYTCLQHPQQVKYFLDRNPHRQGRKLFDTPIIDPAQLPLDIVDVYVGLNPRGASDAIEAIDEWKGRSLRFFYLHERVRGSECI